MSAAQVQDGLEEKYESTVRTFVRDLREEYHIEKETSPREYEAIPELPMGEKIQIDFGHTEQKISDNAVCQVSCRILLV